MGKNPSHTLVRDKTKIEYIRREQSSPHEAFIRVELDPNPHSKI